MLSRPSLIPNRSRDLDTRGTAHGSLGPVQEETERPDEVIPQLLAVDDVIDHAVGQEEFRSLEPLGQLFLDGLFDDLGPAKPIRAWGSAMLMSPSMAKLAVVPPVVGSARTEMKGTLASPIRAIAALVFIICIRDIMPSCIRMPPEQETMMSGRRLLDGPFAGAGDLLADDRGHASAHEGELHGQDVDGDAAHRSPGRLDGLGKARAGLAVREPPGIFLGVHEAQEIDREDVLVERSRSGRRRTASRAARWRRSGSENCRRGRRRNCRGCPAYRGCAGSCCIGSRGCRSSSLSRRAQADASFSRTVLSLDRAGLALIFWDRPSMTESGSGSSSSMSSSSWRSWMTEATNFSGSTGFSK